MKVEHPLLSVFSFYVNSIVRGIESLFIDLSNISQRQTQVQKVLVFESLDAHVVESSVLVSRTHLHSPIFRDSHISLNDSQNVNEQTPPEKLLLLDFLPRTLLEFSPEKLAGQLI